jgi:ribonuclease HII
MDHEFVNKASNLHIEQQLWSEGFNQVMGLDEAGRGCLAGPVVAAGVVLPVGQTIEGVTDSKALSRIQREEAYEKIVQQALDVRVWTQPIEVIEELNILHASLDAMRHCAEDATPVPDMLLVDGNQRIPTLIPQQPIIKGDAKSVSIAAASIIAKVTRDRYMERLSSEYPAYDWASNKGYPTRTHREALATHGITPHHRPSFRLMS